MKLSLLFTHPYIAWRHVWMMAKRRLHLAPKPFIVGVTFPVEREVV